MYGMLCNRPNLAYVISVVSKFMADIKRAYWKALK